MVEKSRGKLSTYILERSKCKDKNLKYDFMPALLEIIERPSHAASKVIVLAITALLIIAIVWANFSRLDIVITGSGQIATEADICVVTAQTSGVIKEIYVSEGDYVALGDTLLELDTSEIDASIAQIENEISYLKVEKEVLELYIADENVQISVTDYDMKYQYMINDIIYENELYRLQKEQQIYNEELLTIQYQSSVNEQLSSIEEKIRGYEDELKTQSLLLDKMVIKSNTTGYIQNQTVCYKGQTVTGYDTLFTIIPSESHLVFEGYIADKDISEVEVGDEVVIKLQAYSFSDYGAVDGKLSYISPSTVSIEGMGNVYIVQVEIDKDTLHEDINLLSGLSGTMEINVGQRSVLDYFLEPIIGDIDDSLKED